MQKKNWFIGHSQTASYFKIWHKEVLYIKNEEKISNVQKPIKTAVVMKLPNTT